MAASRTNSLRTLQSWARFGLTLVWLSTPALTAQPVQIDPQTIQPAVSSQLDRYLLDIQRITTSDGVYDPRLIESYTGIAGVYSQLGDTGLAAYYLNEAFSLARRTDGLDGLLQIPVLDQLIILEASADNFWRVQELQNLRLKIAHDHFGSNTWGFQQALIDYQRWAVTMLKDHPDVTISQHEVEHAMLVSMLDDALEFLERQQAINDEERLAILLEQARSQVSIIDRYPWQGRRMLVADDNGGYSRGGYRQFDTAREQAGKTFISLQRRLGKIHGILARSNTLTGAVRADALAQLTTMDAIIDQAFSRHPGVFDIEHPPLKSRSNPQ